MAYIDHKNYMEIEPYKVFNYLYVNTSFKFDIQISVYNDGNISYAIYTPLEYFPQFGCDLYNEKDLPLYSFIVMAPNTYHLKIYTYTKFYDRFSSINRSNVNDIFKTINRLFSYIFSDTILDKCIEEILKDCQDWFSLVLNDVFSAE